MTNPESCLDHEAGLTILIVLDPSGRLEAASKAPVAWLRAQAVEGGADDEPNAHYSRLFGPGSAITVWISRQIEQARGQTFHAQSNIAIDGQVVGAKFETLTRAEGLFGYGVELSACGLQVSEGDAVVGRQQWHDIKNHLGGLKLYATFLNKKIPEGDDRQIVEKLLKGINSLIDHLARIRRGDST
jgi:hypothetical protein